MDLQRKRFYLLLLYLALLLPLIGYGAYRATGTNANSPLDWVPATFPARAEYDAFVEKFGSGDILIISWPGCTIDDRRMDPFVEELRNAPVFFGEDRAWYFEQVVSGRELVQQLTSPPISLPGDEVLRRFKGTFVGPDGRQTSVIVTFNREGLKRRGKLVTAIEERLQENMHLHLGDWHLAGPVMDGLSVDRAGKAALDRFALPSILMIFYLCYFCLRSWRAATIIFLLSLLVSAITLAFVFYRGEEMSALSIVMPPLVQVLAVSGGIHLVNYYCEALRDPAEIEPAKRSFRMGWLPCLLSAGTTAAGLLSLTVSELTPIRNFGLDAGVGVLVTTALILAFIPGYFHFYPLRSLAPSFSSADFDSASNRFWSESWWELTRILQQVSLPVVALACILMILATRGIQQLETSVRIETLFDGETKVLQDYTWIEEHVGPVVSLEILVDFDESSEVSTIERYRLMARLERILKARAEVAATLSALKFLPQAHQSPKMGQREYDLQLQQILERSRPALLQSGYLHQDEEGETFRVTAFVSALEPIDYGQLLDRMEESLREELFSSGYSQLKGVSLRYTGIMPLVHEIQRQLMRDLFTSFISVFIVITIVMTLVQGGILTGLVAMVPNLFPILLVFGVIGWRGTPVDIGSMMTASVALGVAVDDTLHFLTFFRRGLGSGLLRHEAVNYAFHHCGRAMMQTTLICGIGLLIFTLSDFVPTSRFAWMMLFLLLSALVGDLIVLPALLFSPLGRLFASLRTPDQND